MPNLELLSLVANNLDPDDLPNGCFSGVGSSLRTLNLPDNALTEIRSNLLSGLANLEILDLAMNSMTNIQSGKLTLSHILTVGRAILYSKVGNVPGV